MKKIIALVLLCVGMALGASAQDALRFRNNAVLTSVKYELGTTNLAAPVFMDVRHQSSVRVIATLRGATTSTNLYHFSWSNDGTTYSTNAPDIFIWLADSGSAIPSTRSTNVACGGSGYLVLFQVNTTQLVTNSISYATKTGF